MKNLKFILFSLLALAFVTSCDKLDEQTTQTLAGSTVTFTGNLSSDYLDNDIEGVVVTVIFDENCESADINLNNLSLMGLDLNVDFYEVSCTSTAIYQTGIISATFMGMDYQTEVSFSDFDFALNGTNLAGSFVLTAATYGINAETFTFSTTSTTIVKPQEDNDSATYKETNYYEFEGDFQDAEATFTTPASVRIGIDSVNNLAVITYNDVKFSESMGAITFSTNPLSYTVENQWIRIEHSELKDFYPLVSGVEYKSKTIDYIELVFDEKGLYYASAIDLSATTYIFISDREPEFTEFTVSGDFDCSETVTATDLIVSPGEGYNTVTLTFKDVKLYEGMESCDLVLPNLYFTSTAEGFAVEGDFENVMPIIGEEYYPGLFSVEFYFIQDFVDGASFEIGDSGDFCCSFETFE
ncbi:MAG: hypothetical protein R3Y38_02535 [Rikenellaceae bacterium]